MLHDLKIISLCEVKLGIQFTFLNINISKADQAPAPPPPPWRRVSFFLLFGTSKTPDLVFLDPRPLSAISGFILYEDIYLT